MMYVAVCDDEPVFVSQIVECLAKFRNTHADLRWKTFDSAESFLKNYNNDSRAFDVLITDIEMGKMNGVELATQVRETNRDIIIFFLTCYTSYALQCFRPEPMNFWLKPIEYDVFEKDMRRAAERMETQKKQIVVMENRFPVEINIMDIMYIETLDRKTIIHTISGKHCTSELISHIYDRLPADMFVRVYISYIVNLYYVAKIAKGSVFIKGVEKPLNVSRNYAGDLRRCFIAFKEKRVLGI